MALEVKRQTIIKFDANYLTENLSRLHDDWPDYCRSCGIGFKNDLVFYDYGRGSKRVGRHLTCAIFHKVISVSEAKRIATDETINWIEIEQAVKQKYESRMSITVMHTYYWVIAGALTILGLAHHFL